VTIESEVEPCHRAESKQPQGEQRTFQNPH
jgi:hypothetical protein